MSWVAVGVAAVTVVGGAIQNNQNKKAAQGAANAQTAADMAAIEEQRRQFDLTRQDQMPWLRNGGWAMNQLQNVNAGNYDDFYKSPDYQGALSQGMDAINRQLAAHGGYYSGGGDADRIKFGANLATQTLGNYRNSLQAMAGMGQSSASGLGTLGMGMANNIGGLLQNSGQARASSYLNRADSNNQFIGGVMNTAAGLFGNYMGNRQTPQQQQPQGYANAPNYWTRGYQG